MRTPSPGVSYWSFNSTRTCRTRESRATAAIIPRFTQSADGCYGHVVLDVFLGEKALRCCAFAPSIAWRDGIDSNPARAKFRRQILSRILNGGLGCGIDDSVRQGMAAGARADVDNAATLEPELLDRLLKSQYRPSLVGGESAMEFGNGDNFGLVRPSNSRPRISNHLKFARGIEC